MTKIEFLKKLFKTEDVKSAGCGQCYYVNNSTVWVDNLRGGRMSVKVKPYRDKEQAERVGKLLWNSLMDMNYPVDAATKVDVYRCYSYGLGMEIWRWAVRLRCDKPNLG